MHIAIIQPSYLPWRGFFDIIHEVDCFVFLDDVQFTTRDWRTRNKIKTSEGTCWLTVPVSKQYHRSRICDVQLHDASWQKKHWNSLVHHYKKAPHFKSYAPFFEEFYLKQRWTNLSEMNIVLTKEIAKFLGIETSWRTSSEWGFPSSKQEKLLDILKALGATGYLSGPSAKNYITPNTFQKAVIKLSFKEYHYRPYPQLHPPFVDYLSIVDLLFLCGERAGEYIWEKGEEQ